MATIRTTLTGWAAAVLVLLAAAAIAAESPAARRPPAAGPLKVHPQNPRYFTDGSGKAVLLTGSHTWPSLVDMGAADPPAPFDFAAYLDFLEKFGHNFGRLWIWEPVTWNTKANKRDAVHNAVPQPYARRMNLAAMTPQDKLASTGYCLANPAKEGAEYLVYFPDGGRVTVDLSAAEGRLAVEWCEPKTGNVAAAAAVAGGAPREFSAPFSGDAVLHLVATRE
jgi:hypothetical protein